jgi:hypothetical protein
MCWVLDDAKSLVPLAGTSDLRLSTTAARWRWISFGGSVRHNSECLQWAPEAPDPDQVGRGGRALVDKTGKGDWGFGRHTIGSNFFHYIQDPWGSWFEYYSDMDHIDDYTYWKPTNYDMADSLASWGPPVPSDFVQNHEVSN